MDNQNITQEKEKENKTEINGIGDSIYTESITAIKKVYNPRTIQILGIDLTDDQYLKVLEVAKNNPYNWEMISDKDKKKIIENIKKRM